MIEDHSLHCKFFFMKVKQNVILSLPIMTNTICDSVDGDFFEKVETIQFFAKQDPDAEY